MNELRRRTLQPAPGCFQLAVFMLCLLFAAAMCAVGIHTTINWLVR